MAEEDNPFESPRLLLAGAARHIDAFEAKVLELRATDWVKPSAEADGAVMVVPNVSVPADMKQIVFDITNNLRSALDHAVYASTFLLTGHEGEGTKFPFGDTADEARGDAKRRCKHVPQEMRDFLLAFEAHRYGNPVVWGLNKLRNTKSHRVLVPVAATANLSGIGEPTPGTSFSYEWDPTTGRFKGNLERAQGVEIGAVIYSFRLEILIGTGTFRGEPASSVFDRMLSEVERIVSAIEAETARLLRERKR